MVEFFDRVVLGTKQRGCRVDPITRQSVVFAKHIGDIEYDLIGDDSIAKKSEFIVPTRELILNPQSGENLNEIGQNKDIIKRVSAKRHVNLSN